jgi:hypothetical protein
MEPWQERVITEKQELDEKMAKLDAFRRSDEFIRLLREDQELLNDQHTVMEQYSDVLGRRIARFPRG